MEISTGLEALQKEVGGRIEVVYPFAEPVGLICNDEGKNERMELNRCSFMTQRIICTILSQEHLY